MRHFSGDFALKWKCRRLETPLVFVYSFSLQTVLLRLRFPYLGVMQSALNVQAPPTAGLSGNVTKRGYVISQYSAHVNTKVPPPHGNVIASHINDRCHSQRHFYLRHRRMNYEKHEPSATCLWAKWLWSICLNWSRLIAQTAFLSTLASLENQTLTGATAKRQVERTHKGKDIFRSVKPTNTRDISENWNMCIRRRSNSLCSLVNLSENHHINTANMVLPWQP